MNYSFLYRKEQKAESTKMVSAKKTQKTPNFLMQGAVFVCNKLWMRGGV